MFQPLRELHPKVEPGADPGPRVARLGPSRPSAADDKRWIGDGFYDDSTNWSPIGAAGINDDAIFDRLGTYEVKWKDTTGNTWSRSLQVSKGHATFEAIGGAFLHQVVGRADIFGQGRLSVGGPAASAEVVFLGPVTIDGGGRLDATNGGSLVFSENVTIGDGIIEVTGNGSAADVKSGFLRLGGSATGASNLRITDGGLMTRVGRLEGTGAVTVSGATLEGERLALQGGSLDVINGAVRFDKWTSVDSAITIDGGNSRVEGDILFNGGTFEWKAGSFFAEKVDNVTAQNGAMLHYSTPYQVNREDLTIQSGSTLVTSAPLDVGAGPSVGGRVLVKGIGSKLEITGGEPSRWGDNGGLASVTFRDQASGVITPTLRIGSSSGPVSQGFVGVEGKATLETGSIELGADGSESGVASLSVAEKGSSITQRGASELVIGHASMGQASLNVTKDGLFTTGTGGLTLNPTGRIKSPAAAGSTYSARPH